MTPRIIPPDEAREWERAYQTTAQPISANLAHTAAVLGEQRAAVLALVEKWETHGLHFLDGTSLLLAKAMIKEVKDVFGVTDV